MEIKDNKILDLYKRLRTFITSNYPHAILTENTKSDMINYPGELARIFIYNDKQTKSLLVKITCDITEKMSDSNGRIYYVSSIDELNTVKSGIQVIMDLKTPQQHNQGQILLEAESNKQGYLCDSNGDVMGVVDLEMIPTNAFVYEVDKINNIEEEINEEAMVKKEEQKNGVIRRFFKR